MEGASSVAVRMDNRGGPRVHDLSRTGAASQNTDIPRENADHFQVVPRIGVVAQHHRKEARERVGHGTNPESTSRVQKMCQQHFVGQGSEALLKRILK